MGDITFLELVPMVLALHLLVFKNELSLKMIMFHTDNKALVTIINKKKSSNSKRAKQLVRPLVLHTMVKGMQVKACHISGWSNCIADAISRKQCDRLRKEAPSADMVPLKSPKSFRRLISELKLTDLWMLQSRKIRKRHIEMHCHVSKLFEENIA